MTYFEEMKRKFWTFITVIEPIGNIESASAQIYEDYQDDVQAMAALVTVLNHKCWYWYDNNNEKLSKIYSDLYYKYNELEWNWLEKYGTSDEKSWYFDTLD